MVIVFADMVGYSRLVGLDDGKTLRRLRELRLELIDPAIQEYGGRLAQTAGDSLMIVFDSIDGAVRCAIKIQQQVPLHDIDHPPDRRIRFRFSIDIGDAIPHETNLVGNAVNIAARLQTVCPEGGICVSRAIRDHVHGRLGLTFQPLGPQTLKNIAQPIEAFLLRVDAIPTRPPWRQHWPAATLGVCRGASSAGRRGMEADPAARKIGYRCGAGCGPDGHRIAGCSPSECATAFSGGAALPANLGGDRADDYLVDGITDDLTGDLSHIPGAFVISRVTAMTFRGKAVDVRSLGTELGVRFALEGSVRRFGDMLRVNVQLISTETGAHVWADRFDQQVGDLAQGQDEIVIRIRSALFVTMTDTDIEAMRLKKKTSDEPETPSTSHCRRAWH